jgi:hypothetical protein
MSKWPFVYTMFRSGGGAQTPTLNTDFRKSSRGDAPPRDAVSEVKHASRVYKYSHARVDFEDRSKANM